MTGHLMVRADNWSQDRHGQYLHRNSPELMLRPVLPFALTLEPMPLDGDGVIAWRKFAGAHARRPAADSRADGEMAEAEKVA